MKSRHYTLLSITILVILWWIGAVLADNPIKFPTPIETLIAFSDIVTSKTFFLQVLSTLRRAMIGFVIAFAGGVCLGIVSGVSNQAYYLLRPLILAQRSVPTMAVILLALIWLGRDIAPILVGIILIFPIIYSAVVDGIRHVDVQLLEMVKVYHISKKKRLYHLYLPSIRSSLFAVASAAISLNLKVTIAAEVLSQPGQGIGTGFQMEKIALNTAGLLAWAVIAIALGALLEFLVSPRFFNLIGLRGVGRTRGSKKSL